MSFSDFILAILVLAGAACIAWVYDFNPYSKKLHVYTQTCNNMILDNTYCKGDWVNNPATIFLLDDDAKTVARSDNNNTEAILYSDCTIQDRKNWDCQDEVLQKGITIKDGIITSKKDVDVRQISRLEWIQNLLLEKVS